MKYNVILKRNYRGLLQGTEFGYNEESDSWVFENREEDIRADSIISQTSKIQFSNSFVESKPDLFESNMSEKEDKEYKELIDKYETLLEQLQEELKELKP